MVRNIFLCLLGLTVLGACTSVSTTSPPEDEIKVILPTQQPTVVEPAADARPEGETSPVQVALPAAKMGKVNRSFQPNKAATPFQGKKRFAASWTDADGDQILIISGRYVPNEEEGRMEIFAYQYQKTGEAWGQVWKINDFVDGYGCDLAIHLPETAIRIQDVDGDERGEVSFIYELDDRCDASMVRAKLLLHHLGKKYAIRGFGQQFLGPPEHIYNKMMAEQGDDPVKYKAFDPAFESAPAKIRDFASQEWDAFIASEKDAN